MMNPEMIDDAIEIIREGIRRRKRMGLIINNRAGGNASLIAQRIGKRLQEVKLEGRGERNAVSTVKSWLF